MLSTNLYAQEILFFKIVCGISLRLNFYGVLHPYRDALCSSVSFWGNTYLVISALPGLLLASGKGYCCAGLASLRYANSIFRK